jgi:hypothetical protein
MVAQNVLVRDKWRVFKRVLIVLIILVVVLIVLFVVYSTGVFFGGGTKIVLENPLGEIVLGYSETGQLSVEQVEAVVQEAILQFDEDYINYILVALGVNKLHKSITFENPKIEINVGEVWSSEIVKGVPNTVRGGIDKEDIRFVMSKEEAVRALLSDDIEGFMKDSVASGKTEVEMVAGKVELFSKGYLGLYTDLTGEEVDME